MVETNSYCFVSHFHFLLSFILEFSYLSLWIIQPSQSDFFHYTSHTPPLCLGNWLKPIHIAAFFRIFTSFYPLFLICLISYNINTSKDYAHMSAELTAKHFGRHCRLQFIFCCCFCFFVFFFYFPIASGFPLNAIGHVLQNTQMFS